jgi:cysteinyl-tRNA synthetase
LAEACRTLYLELSGVLGIPFIERKDELTPEQQELFEARKAARKAKNWAESDRIRDELKAQGIIVEDTPQGMKWKRA